MQPNRSPDKGRRLRRRGKRGFPDGSNVRVGLDGRRCPPGFGRIGRLQWFCWRRPPRPREVSGLDMRTGGEPVRVPPVLSRVGTIVT